MKTYSFEVYLCGGVCGGVIEIDATDEDEAYEMAMDHVAEVLVDGFPTLDIQYGVELVDEK